MREIIDELCADVTTEALASLPLLKQYVEEAFQEAMA